LPSSWALLFCPSPAGRSANASRKVPDGRISHRQHEAARALALGIVLRIGIPGSVQLCASDP
jgi:hypothetical protein